MSFSSEVKAELEKSHATARHCRIAELAAMISMVADIIYIDDTPKTLVIVTERSIIARSVSRLIWQLFGIKPEAVVRRTGRNSRSYKMYITDSEQIKSMLLTLKLEQDMYPDGMPAGRHRISCQDMRINRTIIFKQCCKRAFLRGVFMTSGSVNNPEKGYHLEIVCDNDDRADFIETLIRDFDIEAKKISRKRYSVVYIKDGTAIVDILNIMGAHNSLMNMENVRILKDISNNVNRKVNCEVANQKKTAEAYVKQAQDITFIIERKGLTYLPENLRELAEVRLEMPDASLKELGEMMNPPIGKSGVNHRLRKISEIADKLRESNFVTFGHTRGDHTF